MPQATSGHMFFTPEFNKVAKWFLVISILVTAGYYFFAFLGLDRDNASSVFLFRSCLGAISVVALSYAAYCLTQSRNACIVFAVALMIQQFSYIYATENPDALPSIIGNSLMSSYGVRVVLSGMSYALLGYLLIRRPRGLLLGIAGILSTMGIYWIQAQGYMDVLDAITGSRFISNTITLKVPMENGYMEFNPLGAVINALINFNPLILLWVGILFINNRDADLTMRTIDLRSSYDKVARSIVHWSLRLFLITSAFGLLSKILRHYYRVGLSISFLFGIICFCMTIYILGSLYRNNLTYEFVSREKYPSWLYFFLNAPFVHLFYWLYLMRKKKAQAFIDGDLQGQRNIIARLEENYSLTGRNSFLAIFSFAMFICLSLAFVMITQNSRADAGLLEGLGVAVLINVVVLIWIYNKQYAAYYLFILYLLFLIPLYFVWQEGIAIADPGKYFYGLLISYPLFHWHQFRYIGGVPSDRSDQEE